MYLERKKEIEVLSEKFPKTSNDGLFSPEILRQRIQLVIAESLNEISKCLAEISRDLNGR